MSVDGATYDLSVITPATYRTAATGALQSEHLGNSENVARFRSPASLEAPSVFIGPYQVAERRSGTARLRTYFHDPDPSLATDYLDAAERYIEMFEQRIGPYPFTDFFMVSAPLPVGLGFPNLTYVDHRILRLPFMRGRSLAHEVAHNWWGNGVRPDYETGNWSEGLTTYMADHGLAEQESAVATREMRLGWLRDYAALPDERDAPVTDFVSKRHDAAQVIGYGKVAFIFNMLEHEIGSDQFAAALKSLWQDHKFGTAGWSDIRSASEEASSKDLGWFFDQWTGRAGSPRLTLENVQTFARGEKHVLEIALAQTGPAYRLKVPVRVTTPGDTHAFDVRLDGANAVAQLELDDKPLEVEIDPDHMLFRRLLPGEAPPILRDVLLRPRGPRAGVAQRPDECRARQRTGKSLVRSTAQLSRNRPGCWIAGYSSPCTGDGNRN